METTKQKVDVKAIMDRANSKTKAVKESTEKVQGKTSSFRIVPGFTKYEFNGIILRNLKTRAIIKFKTGRNKYQINDDQGKSRNISNDELKAMMPALTTEKVVKEKKVKEPRVKKEKPLKVKKEKIVNVEFEANKELDEKKVSDLSKKEILSSNFKNHKIHYMLHLKGCSFVEIEQLTKKPLPSIKRDVWRYQTGKTVL